MRAVNRALGMIKRNFVDRKPLSEKKKCNLKSRRHRSFRLQVQYEYDL